MSRHTKTMEENPISPHNVRWNIVLFSILFFRLYVQHAIVWCVRLDWDEKFALNFEQE